MADSETFLRPDTTLIGSDQFHRASSVAPYHHPDIEGSCLLNTTGPCSFTSISITENIYNSQNDFIKDETFQVAASEMRVKMKARQSLRMASGELDADFHKYDETEQNCAQINQAALDWALSKSNERVLKRYNKFGTKMVMVDDRNTINGGKWIIVDLTFTENDDKSEVAVSSYAYRMSEQMPVEMFAGDHYCKILSPFKAMEWITTDSLYAKLAAVKPYEEEHFLQ